jgi:hypothetical protein
MCPQKDALLESHSYAVAEWTRLSSNLVTAYHAFNDEVASLLLSQAEAARMKTEQTREALRSHIAEHAC